MCESQFNDVVGSIRVEAALIEAVSLSNVFLFCPKPHLTTRLRCRRHEFIIAQTSPVAAHSYSTSRLLFERIDIENRWDERGVGIKYSEGTRGTRTGSVCQTQQSVSREEEREGTDNKEGKEIEHRNMNRMANGGGKRTIGEWRRESGKGKGSC